MRTTTTTTRRVLLAIGTIGTTAALAACGSSSSASTSSTKQAARGQAGTLAACLRKHGVNLPAGGGPGGGVPGGGAAPSGAPGAGYGSPGGSPPAKFPGATANSGKFRAALKACGANFPRGRRPGGFSKQAIQKYVSCVRQYGYNLPSPNLSGTGSVFPANIRSNPKFQAASRSCQNLLGPAGSAGAPPGA
jgi:hypothetical protein